MGRRSERVQVLLEKAERQRFREQARREGLTLSAWMAQAARDRLAEAEAREGPWTVERLRAFFAACDARETGEEPDWEDHRRVIDGSIGSGQADA